MRFLILIYILFFSACSIKDYKLFQDEKEEYSIGRQDLNISYHEKIIPDDILLIKVFNNGKILKKEKEYIVDDDGTIELPLLSEIKVKGMTLKSLNHLLKEKYQRYFTSPRVKCRIKNHKIFALGEVSQQGVIPITGNSISIIEVISKLGGLTNHALRNRIRVISENNGKYQMRTIDLTKLSTLNTRNLMVKYNSIVYVEPKTSKSIKIFIEDYSPILQAISTVLGTVITIDYFQGAK